MLKVYKVLALGFLIFGFRLMSFGSINQSAIPPTTGCPDTFTTSLAGNIYQWDFGPRALIEFASDTNTQSAVAFFYEPGTYTVYVNVINGGSSQLDSLTITVQATSNSIALSASADTICKGSQITYTAVPSAYIRYAFLLNDSLVSLTTADNYTIGSLSQGDSIRVLAFNGTCFTSPSPAIHPVVFPIPNPATLTSSVPSDTICGGDTIVFTATPGYDTYAFFVGGSQQQTGPSNVWTTSQLGTQNPVYVKVSKNGCYSAASNIITPVVKTTPFVVLSPVLPSTTVCQGDTVTVTAAPQGLDSYNFFVNSASVQNNASHTLVSSTFVTGDTIVAIGVLNGCSSPVSGKVVMTVNPVPHITLTSTAVNDSSCQGAPVTFTASPSGYATYQFYDGATLLQSSSSPTYTTQSLATGSNIRAFAIDLGCTSPPSDTISIIVTPTPVVTVGTDQTACFNDPATTLTGFSPAGGTWTGTGITDPTGVFTPSSAGNGNHVLTYTYIEPVSGCPGNDSINFLVKPIPAITLTPVVNICEGQSAQLNAISNGVSYSWDPTSDLSAPNISNPVATPAQTTFYTVTVTGGNNCSDTASVNVIVNPVPVAAYTATNVCANVPAQFTNNSTGTTYFWNFGDGGISTDVNPSHQYLSADTFHITLIANLGICSDTITDSLIVFPAAVAAFDVFPLFGYNDNSSPISFTDNSLNAASWFWDFGDQTSSIIQSPSHYYTQTGVYTITLVASNQDGCSDTLTKTNYVTIYQIPQVYIPNVFAPSGGDADNAILLARAKGVKIFDWSIFNRVGEKVFESQDPNQGWNGNYKGAKSPEGVYAYFLKIVFEDDTVRYYKGSVTLLR